MLDANNSHSMRVEPGIGTGADNKRNIHVSISLTSCSIIDGVWSVGCPLNIVQMLSLLVGVFEEQKQNVPNQIRSGKSSINIVQFIDRTRSHNHH